MELSTTLPTSVNVVTFLRQAGYHPISDYHTQKESWVRLLSGGHYPRFHLYVNSDGSEVHFSLHLDQKQSTIAVRGLKRHAGEYDTPVVVEEMERIKRWLAYFKQH